MGKKTMRIQSLDELLGLEPEEISPPFSNIPQSSITFLPPQAIRSFREHPFHLYEGKRLKDLTESIMENGILNPVIVRKIEPDEGGYEYEMLAGHNRQHGAIIAGLEKIPCIVKENISDRDAWVYVIETNVIQRSFTELFPSEKAAILSLRYSKVISQGKRNDIIREIQALEESPELLENETCGNNFHMSRNRDNIGKEYDLSGRMVANYLRIHDLIPGLKLRIDNGEFSLISGVSLSFLQETEQDLVDQALNILECRLDNKKASALRNASGNLTADSVKSILVGDTNASKHHSSLAAPKIKPSIYKKYFSTGISPAEFNDIVDEALALYFSQKDTAEKS